ncbi:MAG TPA: cation:dicarboxylase symporter family transporter, partial [Candidatus Binatia bacterium]|nr:cation:dicarboxylase symporter family transporter [Candidatus Binatia bacterium]
MDRSKLQFRFLLAFFALATLSTVLWAISYYAIAFIGPSGSPHKVAIDVNLTLRYAALFAFCGYAFLRRSLTVWIFAGMLIGVELGQDLGQSAANLQVLSSIFLRLIKTIIAPLIFSTLVVGIAGHSNLKQVGRMGIKALLYFEIVTTLALFIGL